VLRDGDTIFALSSGAGKAGIAVIRTSGPRAGAALQALTGRPLPPERHAVLSALYNAQGELIDRALVLWFPGPRSETGEDVAEFHVHGGRAVVAAMLDALGRQDGARLAEPGEFARRAFQNGKFDLTAVEGLADLVDAETAAQRRLALRQMDGALAELYGAWRSRLLRASALLEAHIDFSEDGVDDATIAESLTHLAQLAQDLRIHLRDGSRGEAIRDGVEVAILGAPNVGKSSLINALARRDAAIVTPVAGTTRDVIEVRLDLDGWPLLLSDTAGLRDSDDLVEIEGVRRARLRAERAWFKLVVFDATRLPSLDPVSRGLLDDRSLALFNKADLVDMTPTEIDGKRALSISALRNTGIDGIRSWLSAALAEHLGHLDAPVFTRARHRQALQDCLRAIETCSPDQAPEILAENCRRAAFALGRITGSIGVEELLDAIFKDFCIGK
jgi:tRNA modification GTPase